MPPVSIRARQASAADTSASVISCQDDLATGGGIDQATQPSTTDFIDIEFDNGARIEEEVAHNEPSPMAMISGDSGGSPDARSVGGGAGLPVLRGNRDCSPIDPLSAAEVPG